MAISSEPGGPGQLAITSHELPPRNPLNTDNVQLSAVLAPGGHPLTGRISWKVFKAGAVDNENTNGELLWSGSGSSPEIKLKPGRYTAEASYGLASGAAQFEVAFGQPVRHAVPLNAATLRVHAVAAKGGPKLKDMFFTLREEAEGDTGDLSNTSRSKAVFHVPAGDYRLIAQHGLAMAEQKVTVLPGQSRSIEVLMASGEISLSAHASNDDDALTDTTFFVYESSETGQNLEVIRSRLPKPKFNLPAGHYRIAAVKGLASKEIEVSVKPGDMTEHKLVLDGGNLALSSLIGEGRQKIDRSVLYRIFPLSGDRKLTVQGELFRSTVAEPRLFLPSGRYRVESQYGWQNARQAREIEVKAGNHTAVEFSHQASNVTLKLVRKAGGPALSPVKWTLKYNGAGTVVISQDAEPKLILQDGDYQAVAQHGDKTYTQFFKATSNKDQIVEVMVP